MGDLISRTELLKMLQYNAKGETDENGEYRRLVAIDIYKLIDYIYHMPTAYDVEAVVAELEKEAEEYNEKADRYSVHEDYFMRYLSIAKGIEKAISIVRGKE